MLGGTFTGTTATLREQLRRVIEDSVRTALLAHGAPAAAATAYTAGALASHDLIDLLEPLVLEVLERRDDYNRALRVLEVAGLSGEPGEDVPNTLERVTRKAVAVRPIHPSNLTDVVTVLEDNLAAATDQRDRYMRAHTEACEAWAEETKRHRAELEALRLELQAAKRCDGEHPIPGCGDPQCWTP